MSTLFHEGNSIQDAPASPGASEAGLFDTRGAFEKWFDELSKQPGTRDVTFHLDSLAHIWGVGFTGELNLGGGASGKIQSLEGTLIVGEDVRIALDVEVRVALIKGAVAGNITASERVELAENAKVIGDIRAPSLTMRDGAILEGSFFVAKDSDAAVGRKAIATCTAA